MPSHETRRILKEFGIAVTDFEDAVDQHAAAEDVAKAEAAMTARLEEVTHLIEGLRAKKR